MLVHNIGQLFWKVSKVFWMAFWFGQTISKSISHGDPPGLVNIPWWAFSQTLRNATFNNNNNNNNLPALHDIYHKDIFDHD